MTFLSDLTDTDLKRVLSLYEEKKNINIYCIFKGDFYKLREKYLRIVRIIDYKIFYVLLVKEDKKYLKGKRWVLINRMKISVFYCKSVDCKEFEIDDYQLDNYTKRYLELIENHLIKGEDKKIQD